MFVRRRIAGSDRQTRSPTFYTKRTSHSFYMPNTEPDRFASHLSKENRFRPAPAGTYPKMIRAFWGLPEHSGYILSVRRLYRLRTPVERCLGPYDREDRRRPRVVGHIL